MARVVRDLGMALSQLAHVCQKDEPYIGEDDPKIIRAKTIVQVKHNLYEHVLLVTSECDGLHEVLFACSTEPKPNGGSDRGQR